MTARLLSVVPAAAGAGYSPRDSITLAGGTFTVQGVLLLATTKVSALAVVTPGSGGTAGPQILRGTTGTGTLFTCAATIAGGAISGTPTLLTFGSYSDNPADIAHEPVLGGGLAGGVLALTMGVDRAIPTEQGLYTVVPPNPVAQASTTGLGSSATFTASWSGVTAAIFRANFPAFADTTDFPDTQINYWLSIAQALLPANRLGNMLDFATQLFLAHNLSLERMSNAAGAAGAAPGLSRGPISGEGVGPAHASYDTASGIPLNAGHWALTTYGTRFFQLIRNRGAGPIQVGIGSPPPYLVSGQAWAGPTVWVPAWFTI